MPVYQNQGPQQYAMHQQNRKDDWIRQLLQMFMMKQRQGRQDERWEQEHELSQRRTKAYETQAETQRKQAEKPGKPSAFYEKFITAYQIFGGDAKLAYQKATDPTWEPPKTSERIEEESTARARGAGTGKFAPPKGITPTSKATAAESLRRYKLDKENAAQKAKWTRQKTFITNKTKRLVTERERMVKGLDPENEDFMEQQQPRIANIDKAIAEMDRIDALLSTGGLLPPEEFSKAKNLITHMEYAKMGLYDFEHGVPLVDGKMNEKAVPKDIEIQTSATTGERFVQVNGKWYLITKSK